DGLRGRRRRGRWGRRGRGHRREVRLALFTEQRPIFVVELAERALYHVSVDLQPSLRKATSVSPVARATLYKGSPRGTPPQAATSWKASLSPLSPLGKRGWG